MEYRLKYDVVGSKKNVYGKEGEVVKLIAKYGEVAIVENLKDVRFSVRFENLIDTVPNNNIKPVEIIVKPLPTLNKKACQIKKQSSLFD